MSLPPLDSTTSAGYFVWPNAEKLTLKENKKTQNPQVWFKGAPGKSCTQVCQDMGGSCFAEALGSVKNPVSLQAAIGRHYACKLPMLKGECNKGMPAEATSDSFCSYQTCDKAVCEAKYAKQARFCPCKDVTASLVQEGSEVKEEEVPGANDEDSWSEMTTEGTSAQPKTSCGNMIDLASCEAMGCFFREEEGIKLCSTFRE